MIRRSVVVWLAAGSVAFAADTNEDGCQDEFASGGGCVDVDATFDASSSIGNQSSVLPFASVGPQVAIGSGVTIAPRASLAGRVSSPSNPLPIGANTVIGRSVQLGADHILGADVTIGRSVQAGARLNVGSSSTLGYGVQAGDDVTIGTGATLGALVTLGDHATVGDNATLARGVTVADGANISDGAIIDGTVGPDVTLGSNVRIDAGARIRKDADIADDAIIQSSARIGRDANIGAGANVSGRIAAGATVGAGAVVEDGATVLRGAEVCSGSTVPDGAFVASDGTWPVEGCDVSSTCKTLHDADPGLTDGVYNIDPDGQGGLPAFDAWCDMDRNGGGWTLVMQNNVGITNPNPTFVQSTTGVTVNGSMSALGNFDTLVGLAYWEHIGTEARHEVGNSPEAPNNQAIYQGLSLTGPTFVLNIDSANVTVGSTLSGMYNSHRGYGWTTFDQDNDIHGSNCATFYDSPFWYYNCYNGNFWGGNANAQSLWSPAGNWGAIWLR